MTGLPDNNGNDFIRGLETRACVNGMTKSDVERLKNALVKKILDDETVIDVTEDGSIVADSNGMFISVNGQTLGLSVDGEDVIPVTEPYLPEDENENPLAPPNDTIMTSANIGVDPRIVHTTGNEEISGDKSFNNYLIVNKDFRWLRSSKSISSTNWARMYELSRVASSSVLFQLYNDNLISSMLDCKLLISTGSVSSGRPVSGALFGSESRIASGKIAIRSADNIVEIWIKAGSSNLALVGQCEHIRGSLTITPAPLDGDEPTVGNVYSEVIDITIN